MIYLVIAPTQKHFAYEFKDRIGFEEVETMNSQGRIMMKTGDEYVYISHPYQLQGYHGVKVLQWGPWSQALRNHPDTETYIRMAELP